MVDFLLGLAIGIAVTWLVMKFLTPTVFRDKVTKEVTSILVDGRTFVDSAVKKL